MRLPGWKMPAQPEVDFFVRGGIDKSQAGEIPAMIV
jgi:hypothetical protein